MMIPGGRESCTPLYSQLLSSWLRLRRSCAGSAEQPSAPTMAALAARPTTPEIAARGRRPGRTVANGLYERDPAGNDTGNASVEISFPSESSPGISPSSKLGGAIFRETCFAVA